jgi:glutamine amidotransferase
MCIIALKEQDATISKETLQQCFKANKDGAGFMYAEDNILHTEKGFFSFDDFYKAYTPHQSKKIALHFRIKTHGEINKDNCHPFEVSKTLGLMHNGMIDIQEYNKKFSDTWHFNEKIIKPMYRDNGGFLKKNYNLELIKKFVGYSKLVFLNNRGVHTIVNEDKGVWENGVWYSNTSYKIPTFPVVKQHQDTSWRGFKSKWKFLEGDYISFNAPWKHFKTGDWGQVERVLGNGQLSIITHEYMGDGKTIEVISTVPQYVVSTIGEADYYS